MKCFCLVKRFLILSGVTVGVLLLSAPVAAQSLSPSSSPLGESSLRLPVAEGVPMDQHRNYFGPRLASTLGAGIFYSRRVSDRWLIGGGLSYFGNQGASSKGGDLDHGQYYEESYTLKSSFVEMNSTFYFRDQGYKRWGFLTRGSLGYANRQASANWTRYERENSILQIFTDKRSVQSQDYTADWSTPYARVGAYYQFVFQRKTEAWIVGHVIEVGASAFFAERRGSLSYTKPSGDTFTQSAPAVEPMVEIAYSFVF